MVTEVIQQYLSDLVVHEVDPKVGYARRSLVVEDDKDVVLGTLVYRSKSSGELDQKAEYTVYTTNSALVATNEFAVVFGDNMCFNPSFTTEDLDGAYNAVGFVRDEVILKDATIFEANGITTDGDKEKVKALLEAQGIIIEKVLGA